VKNRHRNALKLLTGVQEVKITEADVEKIGETIEKPAANRSRQTGWGFVS